MANGHLILVDEVTAEDISPCELCGVKFVLGEFFWLDETNMETTGSRCLCLNCVEAM